MSTMIVDDAMSVTLTQVIPGSKAITRANADSPARENSLLLRESSGEFRHTDTHFDRVAVNKALRRQLAAALREAGWEPNGELWAEAKSVLASALAGNVRVNVAMRMAVDHVNATFELV